MKINPNIGTDFGPQDLGSSEAARSLPAVQTDKLEAYENAFGFSFGENAGSEVKTDLSRGATLLTGGRSLDFGVNFVDAFALPADEPVEERSGIFDLIGYGLVDASDDFGGWFGDAMEYLGQGIADTPETFDKIMDAIGEGIVDGGKAVGGAIADAAGTVWDGIEWVGEGAYDAVSSWVENTVEGIAIGFEPVADAIGDLFSW